MCAFGVHFGVHSTPHGASYIRKTHQYHAKAGFSVQQTIALHISQSDRNCLPALGTLNTFFPVFSWVKFCAKPGSKFCYKRCFH